MSADTFAVISKKDGSVIFINEVANTIKDCLVKEYNAYNRSNPLSKYFTTDIGIHHCDENSIHAYLNFKVDINEVTYHRSMRLVNSIDNNEYRIDGTNSSIFLNFNSMDYGSEIMKSVAEYLANDSRFNVCYCKDDLGFDDSKLVKIEPSEIVS